LGGKINTTAIYGQLATTFFNSTCSTYAIVTPDWDARLATPGRRNCMRAFKPPRSKRRMLTITCIFVHNVCRQANHFCSSASSLNLILFWQP